MSNYVDRQSMVRAFFNAVGQRQPRIGEATEEELRLGLRLVAEEFFELLEAAFGDAHFGAAFTVPCEIVMRLIDTHRLAIDLPELIDATVDLDYVCEGLRVSLGVNGDPIWHAIHMSNMAKSTGPIRADGKRMKPEGWIAPDVGAFLRAQGWAGR